MIKIALDSSCLNARKEHNILNKLENLEKSGKIKLVTSTVNEKEQCEKNPSTEWRERYLKIINNKHKVLETGRFDISTYDNCVYGSDEANRILKEIFPNPSNNDFFDLWLLETALVHKCDYFLTLNAKDFIEGSRKEKIEGLGIKVREPNEDFLQKLSSLI